MNSSPTATLVVLLKILRSRHAEVLVGEYVAGLDSLPDDTMRQVRLTGLLTPLPDEVAVEVLDLIVRGAQEDRPRFRAVLGSIIDLSPLLAALGEKRAEEWREVARRERFPGILALLTTADPKRSYYARHQVDVNEQLESPLGRRKSLARGFNRSTLDRLLFDKHPGVVRILLDNPRITERDVVKIAALQPTTPATLQTVFSHPRWSRRYSVKRALVFNPYVPVPIAQSLLSFMLEPDLQAVSRARRLAREIRDHAQKLLIERRGRRHPILDELTLAEEPEAPREDPATSAEALASEFLASLGDVESTLLNIVDDLEEETAEEAALEAESEDAEAEAEAEAFLRQLPGKLTLVPVGEDDDE